MNRISRKMKLRALALLAAGTSAAPAFADLPASATTAIGAAGTDTTTALGLIIGVVVGIWALRKVVGLFGR
ncbi:MAG: hypothetical protein HZB71_08900 [Betaproteobacteria bacterium]|nr:hypothetical protein [Betaproteobacteria bacterium]